MMGLGDDSDNSAGASDLEDVDDITSDDDEMIQNMKAQAKALKQRIRLARGAEPGDSDEEEGADAAAKQELRDRLWGASKRNYYGADEGELIESSALSALLAHLERNYGRAPVAWHVEQLSTAELKCPCVITQRRKAMRMLWKKKKKKRDDSSASRQRACVRR